MSDSIPAIGDRLLPAEATRLYVKCQSTLRPALTGRLGCQADADDVLHEAFARLLSNYASRSILNPLALLARIAMNIVRDSARSQASRNDLLSRHGTMLESAIADPETEASDRQHLRLLCDAIDSLPPRCRQVFLLCRVDGLPHAEAARTLGISKSGVEKQLIRAQASLDQKLGAISSDCIDRSRPPHI